MLLFQLLLDVLNAGIAGFKFKGKCRFSAVEHMNRV
jgi:hypothetical protein